MPRNDNVEILENVRIMHRNFAGKEGMYNQEGDRNFSVIIDDRTAKRLANDGWNVKWRPPYEEGDPETPYLPVSVKYRGRGGKELRPPRIVMITSRGRNPLSENEVEILDWADIVTCDMIIRPHEWEMNGKSGTKAYLQSMFVTIEEDPLELKYSGVNDAPGS